MSTVRETRRTTQTLALKSSYPKRVTIIIIIWCRDGVPKDDGGGGGGEDSGERAGHKS